MVQEERDGRKFFGPREWPIVAGDAAIITGRLAVVLGAIAFASIATRNVAAFPLALLANLAAAATLLLAVFALLRLHWGDKRIPEGFSQKVSGATEWSVVIMGLSFIFTFLSSLRFSRGRQLRSFGRILLPEVTPGDRWTKVTMAVDVEDEVRAELAGQWRENGRTEHASVAAFARLSLDLMALGAPPALLSAASQDAQDEIRHTELCFSLARSLDGRAESPAAFRVAKSARTLPPGRSFALAALAVDSLIDGALHEGVSARIIARLAKRCNEPQIRSVLKEIAADEGRHAAHGWDVVEWCLAEGGEPVAAALRGALRALPASMHADLPAAAEHGGWERYGIHGRALETEEFAAARLHLVERVERLLAGRFAAAA